MINLIDGIFYISMATFFVFVGERLYDYAKDKYLRKNGKRVTVTKNGKFAFTLTTNSKELTNQSIVNIISDGYKVE